MKTKCPYCHSEFEEHHCHICPPLPKSRHPHKNKFVVQATIGAGGWVDTVHGADTLLDASLAELALKGNDASWMPDDYLRITRIAVAIAKAE